MSENTAEVLTGGGVLAVAVGFLIYAAQFGGVGGGSADASTYSASFRSAEGIGVGTDVRMAGVKVGTVLDMSLDPQTFRANATLSVDDAIELPEDTAVIVASEGLLGGSFLELQPGGSAFSLEPGSEIEDTQSSVSLIELLLKFVAGNE